MKFTDYLTEWLNARHVLDYEQSKSTVSNRAVLDAEEDVARCADALNEFMERK